MLCVTLSSAAPSTFPLAIGGSLRRGTLQRCAHFHSHHGSARATAPLPESLMEKKGNKKTLQPRRSWDPVHQDNQRAPAGPAGLSLPRALHALSIILCDKWPSFCTASLSMMLTCAASVPQENQKSRASWRPMKRASALVRAYPLLSCGSAIVWRPGAAKGLMGPIIPHFAIVRSYVFARNIVAIVYAIPMHVHRKKYYCCYGLEQTFSQNGPK